MELAPLGLIRKGGLFQKIAFTPGGLIERGGYLKLGAYSIIYGKHVLCKDYARRMNSHFERKYKMKFQLFLSLYMFVIVSRCPRNSYFVLFIQHVHLLI